MTNNPTIDGVSRLGTCEMIQALLDLDARGSLAPHGIGGLARDVLTKAQSTIARLEARITQLESEKEFAAATYQAARDRIAELESGRGEPVKLQHMAVAEDGKLRWMSGRKMQDCELYAMPDGSAIRQQLFTGQPAPVAAVLPDRQSARESFECGGVAQEQFSKGLNACLDATAALNEVKS